MIAPRKDIQAALVKHRKALLALSEDELAPALVRILENIERKMIAAMRRYPGSVKQADILRVRLTINRIVLESLPELAAWMQAGFPKGALNGVRTQAEFLKKGFEVTRWQEIPVAKVRDTFQAFATAAGNGSLTRLDAPLFGKYSAEFTQYATETVAHVEREFLRAVATGDSWSNLAKRVAAQFKDETIPGRINKDAFARAYTRTKLTQIANNASVAAGKTVFGEDAKFFNAGVDDWPHRQSDICHFASQQPPMTDAEWEASEWGKPPRHVMNCRCDLVVVPDFLADETITDEVLELSGEELVKNRMEALR